MHAYLSHEIHTTVGENVHKRKFMSTSREKETDHRGTPITDVTPKSAAGEKPLCIHVPVTYFLESFAYFKHTARLPNYIPFWGIFRQQATTNTWNFITSIRVPTPTQISSGNKG
ncbi:hypothetical protein FRC02_008849 [Tulasnella sp. 418]|nr:hypothetical protein FRC02_008849 [Tulasnella sp. 418]